MEYVGGLFWMVYYVYYYGLFIIFKIRLVNLVFGSESRINNKETICLFLKLG